MKELNEEHAKSTSDLPPSQDIPILEKKAEKEVEIEHQKKKKAEKAIEEIEQQKVITPNDVEDIPHFLDPKVEDPNPSEEDKRGNIAMGMVHARRLTQEIDDELQADYWLVIFIEDSCNSVG